ncbi:hypothetical protein ACSESZ_00895 [Pseudomonas aeruginosa]|uniref:hypothetical protein n=1 Tax=Pseudomonas aeruginosa TaxID=287 RepID=UPI001F45738B|nr:hypothetical protein [Pseudomonas aeruginosa]UIN43651.1 hypothetical protein LXN03_12195 [Pseudomonas aeruginosa]HCI4017208.1 hypothetical protein [Pseudomonas aeruginosa]
MSFGLHAKNCGKVVFESAKVGDCDVGLSLMDCNDVEIRKVVFERTSTAVKARGVKRLKASDITHDSSMEISPLAIAVAEAIYANV